MEQFNTMVIRSLINTLSRSSRFCMTAALAALAGVSSITLAQEQDTLPSWKSYDYTSLEFNTPVSTIDAPVSLTSLNTEALVTGLASDAATAELVSVFTSTDAPEPLLELVRGLKSDPGLIYHFVKDEIDIEFTYGTKKGPLGTFLDRSGNVFDQVDLLVNLLEIAGFEAKYRLVDTTISIEELSNWFKVDVDQVQALLTISGVDTSSSDGTNVTFKHLFASVTYDSTDYLLDPSFKTHARLTAKLDLATEIDFKKANFITSTITDSTVNRSALHAELNAMADALESHLSANYDTSSVDDALGGWHIIQTNGTDLVNATYVSGDFLEWDELPASYTTTLNIQHQGINHTFDSREIYTKRLSMYYPPLSESPVPTLYLDGQVVATGESLARGTTSAIRFEVNHPNPALEGRAGDQTWEQILTSGGTYNIVNTWGHIGPKHLAYQNVKMAELQASDLEETSEALQNQSFMLIGQNWAQNVTYANTLESKIQHDQKYKYHLVGVAGTNDISGVNGGPFIDLGGDIGGGSSQSFGSFVGNGLLNSAFEHGVIEQTQPFSAVSTVKLLDIASEVGEELLFTNVDNWGGTLSTPNPAGPYTCDHLIKSTDQTDIINTLSDYSCGDELSITQYVQAGYSIILPASGSLGSDEYTWSGAGFVALKNIDGAWSAGLIISGGYKGGYSAQAGGVNGSAFGDGVRYATGHGQYQHTDITVGSGVNQLSFSRNYDSSRVHEAGDFSNGWRHNYDYAVSETSNIPNATGAGTPLNATAALVAIYVVTELLSELDDGISGDITDSVGISAGVYFWLMEQLTNSTVNVSMPVGTESFVKLPSGNFSAAPASRSVLTGTTGSLGSYELTMKNGTSLGFDSDGHVDDITDRNDNTLTLSYIDGALNKIENEYGRSLTLGYSGDAIGSVTDENSRSVSYQYTDGELSGFTNTLDHAITYDYDASERLSKAYAPENSASELFYKTYDSQHRVISQVSSLGATYHYYYADGYRTEISDGLARSQVIYLNDDYRVVKSINALGEATTHQYDGINRLTTTVYADGAQQSIAYDGQDNPTTITRKAKTGSTLADIVEKAGYTTFGHISYSMNAEDHRTDYGYDDNGNLLTIQLPTVDEVRLTTTHTYHTNGTLDTSTGPDGVKVKYEYYESDVTGGSHGEVKKQIVDPDVAAEDADVDEDYEGQNLTTEYTYWSSGDVKTVKDALEQTISYEYDDERRLTKQTQPVDDETNLITQTKYDKNGRPETVSQYSGDLTLYADTEGWAVTTYDYFLDGQIKSIEDAAGDKTSFTYDAMGNQQTVTDGELKKTKIEYDVLYRPQYEKQESEGVFVTLKTYTYYADSGLLDTLTDADDNQTDYDYDGFNRVSTVTYHDDTEETYTYYADSQVKTMTARNDVVTTYQYDANNQITQQLVGSEEKRVFVIDKDTGLQDKINHYVPADASEARTIDYDYDDLARVDKITDANNRVVEYGYDALGRQETLTYPDDKVLTYQFDKANRIDKVLFENSEIVDYDYNALSQITDITNANGTSSSLTYENDGDIGTLIHSFTGDKTLGYSYSHYQNAQQKSKQYLGDATYWALSTGYTQSYTASTLNQYDAVGASSLGYDDNGNLDTTEYTLTHSSLNQLTKISADDADDIVYTYDGQGRRASNNAWGTATYVYDGQHMIAEYDENNTITQRFIYAPGIDRPLVFETASVRYFYHVDELGSVVALSDTTGALVEQYSYGPFGQSDDVSTLGNPLRYTARRLDTETGYYYYRARYYDPEYGRFLQADPLGFADGMNRYAYVGNDPINLVDPMGTFATMGGFSAIEGLVEAFSEQFTPAADWETLGSGADAITSSVGPADVVLGAYTLGRLTVSGVSSLVSTTGSSTAGSIRNVNATGGTRNCVNCSIATDATLAGRPASALAGNPTSISVLEQSFGAQFSSAISRTAIERSLLRAGNGARGIIFGSRGNQVGHVFNVVNQRGTIRFLDGQTGAVANLNGYRTLHLLRTNP